MKVSVLTSYYNASQNTSFFLDAYRSLQEQEVDWEWILQCDAEMPADQREIAERDPRIQIFENPHRLGTAISKNRALARSQGEYIFALDDDDILPPGSLRKLLGALQQNPDCFAAWGHCYRFEGNGEPVPFRTWPEESRVVLPGEISDQFEKGHFALTAATLLWRREHLLALGGWMALLGSEDTGLVVTASSIWPSVALAESVYLYRIFSDSVTSQEVFRTEKDVRHNFIRERVRSLRNLLDEL